MESKKSLFLETFGDSPHMKALDFFLTFPGFDYSKTQVADETGISRITMEKIWVKLTETGLIRKTRTIGRAEMYCLNKQNPRVKALIELDLKLSKAYAEMQAPMKQKIKIRSLDY
ncbi:MAG: hypothetical protein V1658_00580 [Candidatus Micrarchaeota archaeon]